ncbi:MAG: M48 family metalloprotease [Bryobacteraceae bacterium]|nr:M48 family metalloprotease [Bryobacteraceae bacterium]
MVLAAGPATNLLARMMPQQLDSAIGSAAGAGDGAGIGAARGGCVVLNWGLIRSMGSGDELAAVVAHEKTHVQERQAVARAGVWTAVFPNGAWWGVGRGLAV